MKNLNYTITGEDLYDLFGRYGSIRQIRIGTEAKTKGTAFVVYDDVMDVRICAYALLGSSSNTASRLRTRLTTLMVFTCKSDTSLFFTTCRLSKTRQLRRLTLREEKKNLLL